MIFFNRGRTEIIYVTNKSIKVFWLNLDKANFRLSDPEAKICSPNSSSIANKIYLDNRYPPHKTCRSPCTDMNLGLVPMGRTQTNTSFRHDHNTMTIFPYTDIEVLTEVMPKTLLMLIAEVGGYLGLTLGFSLLDLKLFAPASWNFIETTLEHKLNEIKIN